MQVVDLKYYECCLMEISDPRTVVWSLWDTCWDNDISDIGKLNFFQGKVTYASHYSIEYIINTQSHIGYPFYYFGRKRRDSGVEIWQ